MTKLTTVCLAILALAGPALAQGSKPPVIPDLSDLPAGNLSNASLDAVEKRILADLRKVDPKLSRKISSKLVRTPSLRDRYLYLVKQVVKLDERIDLAELRYKKRLSDKTRFESLEKARRDLIILYIGYGDGYFEFLDRNFKHDSKRHQSIFSKKIGKYADAYWKFRAERRKELGLHKEVGKTEPTKKKANDKLQKPGTKKTKKVSRCDEAPGGENCAVGGDVSGTAGPGTSETAAVVDHGAPADHWGRPLRSPAAFADMVVELAVGSPRPTKGGFDPANALGAPDWDGDDYGPTYTTLGCGGSLVVRFSDGGAVDRAGPDFRVYEIGPNVEPYRVEVSSDGLTWYVLGTQTRTGSFDIAGAAPEDRAYGFLRITDLRAKCTGGWPGADIDAVEALNPAAAPQGTLLRCIARGASPTATGRHPAVVRNGDFLVTGNASYRDIGDAYNERTRWTCELGGQLPTVGLAGLEVRAAVLNLVLVTGEEGWFHTDTVSIDGLPAIADPAIRGRKKNSRTEVAIDLLSHYRSAEIIARIEAGAGAIGLFYSDDSTVTYAALTLELAPEPARKPAGAEAGPVLDFIDTADAAIMGDLTYGEVFFLRAVFPSAPTDAPGPVGLTWEGGEATVALRPRGGDGRVFMSGPLRFVFDGAAMLEREVVP